MAGHDSILEMDATGRPFADKAREVIYWYSPRSRRWRPTLVSAKSRSKQPGRMAGAALERGARLRQRAPMNSSEETNLCRRAFLRNGSATLLAAVLGAIGVSGSQTNIDKEESQSMPPDANVVRDLMKQNLFGVFGERDAEKRHSLIAKIWDRKGIFIDPDRRYVGHTAINDAAEKVQRRFPDFAFSVLADGDAYGGVGRLPWGFGPPGEPRKITGIDVLVASNDRRITALYMFLDAVKG
jgi:hypothetical protein